MAIRTIGVAFPIPEPYGSELRSWRGRFGDPQARTVPTHVTLLPPTPLEERVLPDVVRHLTKAAEEQQPFTMRLRGTGTFRPVSPVVFVQVAEGISQCERVEAAVRSGILDRPLDFGYHPHVTVAHGVPTASLDEAFTRLAHYEAVFPIEHFSLYVHGDDGLWRPRQDFPLNG